MARCGVRRKPQCAAVWRAFRPSGASEKFRTVAPGAPTSPTFWPSTTSLDATGIAGPQGQVAALGHHEALAGQHGPCPDECTIGDCAAGPSCLRARPAPPGLRVQ